MIFRRRKRGPVLRYRYGNELCRVRLDGRTMIDSTGIYYGGIWIDDPGQGRGIIHAGVLGWLDWRFFDPALPGRMGPARDFIRSLGFDWACDVGPFYDPAINEVLIEQDRKREARRA